MSATVTLDLTPEQIIEFFEKFSKEEQIKIYRRLTDKILGGWIEISIGLEDKARLLARERGLNLDTMTELTG